MFGPVETKLDPVTIRRFISCLIGTGKTTQMLWSINKILEAGETCLLVTPATFLIKEHFPNRKLPEGLKVIHIDTLLKLLKRYKVEDHPENRDTHLNPWYIHRKYIELFDCDRIVIDPECYLKIIEQYADRMEELTKLTEIINAKVTYNKEGYKFRP